MAQLEIEVILTRQLVSHLAQAAFIVSPAGDLLFYNEPAEVILGRRFDETGSLSAAEWGTMFEPTRADGSTLPVEELPLLRALESRRPNHGAFSIQGLDGIQRHIEVTAVPLIGEDQTFHGAVALFWEADRK